MIDLSVTIKIDGVTIRFKSVDDFADWLADIIFDGDKNDGID